MENLGIVIPKNVENLQLPDPDLLHQYEDEEARRIYLEGAIGTEDDPMNDNSIGIVKRILSGITGKIKGFLSRKENRLCSISTVLEVM